LPARPARWDPRHEDPALVAGVLACDFMRLTVHTGYAAEDLVVISNDESRRGGG
jgi:hypothetical protein